MRCVCGKEVSLDREACPNCGRPIVMQTGMKTEELHPNELVAHTQKIEYEAEKQREEPASPKVDFKLSQDQVEQKTEDKEIEQETVDKPETQIPKNKNEKKRKPGWVIGLLVLAAVVVIGVKTIGDRDAKEAAAATLPPVIEIPKPTPMPAPTPVPDVEVQLSDLVPAATSSGGGFVFYTEGHDNHDNYYDNAVGGVMQGAGNWCEYHVLHRYRRFSGVAYLSYDCMYCVGEYTRFTVYGDNELLFESDIITSGVELQKIDIDISNVDILRVCIHGNSYLRVSDCTLTYTPTEDYVWLMPLGEIAEEYTALEFSGAEASSYLTAEEREYPVSNIIDKDTSTCWQEGVDSIGIGETVTLHFSQKQEVDCLSLFLGYSNYYERNGRPKKLRFDFSDGSYGYYIFEDNNQEHLIELERPIKTDWVKITIESAYTGSEFEDTCITEVTAFSR